MAHDPVCCGITLIFLESFELSLVIGYSFILMKQHLYMLLGLLQPCRPQTEKLGFTSYNYMFKSLK